MKNNTIYINETHSPVPFKSEAHEWTKNQKKNYLLSSKHIHQDMK